MQNQTENENATGQIVMLARTDIYPNPHQPRTTFDEAELEQLRQSIRERGLMQPVSVRPLPNRYDGAQYQIIFGERRWRASESVLEFLPCIIVDVSQEEADEMMLDENYQRGDLTAEEDANVVRRYLEQGRDRGWIARRRNKSLGWVDNRISYMKVGDDVRDVGRRVRKAMSALVWAEKVKDRDLRRDLLHRIEVEEMPFVDVKAKVVAHLESAESARRAAANAAAQAKAPDRETEERSNAHERGESSSMSRGQRVTGGVGGGAQSTTTTSTGSTFSKKPSAKAQKASKAAKTQANSEVLRALANLKSWLPLCDNETHQAATDFSRDVLRGDLARESSR